MAVKNAIVSMILILIFFGLGIGFGIYYQAQKAVPVTTVQTTDSSGAVTVQTVPPVVKDLNSKVIPSIAAYGIISKIDGQNLTLTQQGDSVTIAVNSDAKLYAFTNPTVPAGSKVAPAPTSKQINFSDLKVGNNVSVNIKVSTTGQLQGTSVIVLPTSTTTGK